MEAQAHLIVDAPSFFKGRETAMPSGMEWMNIAIKRRIPFWEIPWARCRDHHSGGKSPRKRAQQFGIIFDEMDRNSPQARG